MGVVREHDFFAATALTGGTKGCLDIYRMGADNIEDGDRAIVILDTKPHFFVFDASATDAEDVTTRPYKVRPDDYVNKGVWKETTDYPLVLSDMTAHEAAADPHIGYVKESEFTADGEVLVGTGNGTFQKESGATLRTSLGLGTGDSPQFDNLTVADSGNIGCVSDTDLLTLAADALTINGDTTVISNNFSAGGAGLLLVRNDSSTGSGNSLGWIGFDSTDDSISSSHASVLVGGIASQDHSDTEKGGHFVIRTKADNTDGSQASTERVRVTSAGNMGIGITGPTEKLEVDGNIIVAAGGTIGPSGDSDLLTLASASLTVAGDVEITSSGKLILDNGTRDVELIPGSSGAGDNSLWVKGVGNYNGVLQVGLPVVFKYTHANTFVKAVPGANYSWYFFDEGGNGEQAVVRVYGWPTGEGEKYGQFKVVTGTSSPRFEISTDGEGIELSSDVYHTATNIGFFSTAPVSQRLKANYNSWAAYTDVVDALVALGLFDQA